MNKVFISTPIYYPNDKLHLGHAYTNILADFYARYKKMQNYDVYFVTGSDEHGQKVLEKANEHQQDPKTYVDGIVKNFKKLWNYLEIDYTNFVRTTDKIHKDFVKGVFTKLLNDGHIYKGKYKGYYCKYDEAFFTKFQLLEKNLCPECKREVSSIEEDTYFLKIKSYKDWIANELNNNNILIPRHRVSEMLNNFVNELGDLSITRKSISWGIPINEDPKHVIYVWFDALLNYLSTFNYASKDIDKKFNADVVWNKDSSVEIFQIVGKEITRFHSIYWPIVLNMLGYKIPKILAHGLIISTDGTKMSKSKKNTIDPIYLIDKFGKDVVRFFLIYSISTFKDGYYSENNLIEVNNNIFVNKFANIVYRTHVMIKKSLNLKLPPLENEGEIERHFFKKLEDIQVRAFKYADDYKFSNYAKELVHYADLINSYINEQTPWLKSGNELSSIFNAVIKAINNFAIISKPILLDFSKILAKWLDVDSLNIEDLNKSFAGKELRDIEHIYKRIN